MRCIACGRRISLKELKLIKEKDNIIKALIEEDLISRGLVCYNCFRYRK